MPEHFIIFILFSFVAVISPEEKATGSQRSKRLNSDSFIQ